MAFPDGWNTDPTVGPLGPRATDTRSIHAFFSGITTADFADNAKLWIDCPGANPFKITPVPNVDGHNLPYPAPPLGPRAVIWSNNVWAKNDGLTTVEVSFTGGATEVSWVLLAGESMTWRNKVVAGIAFRFPAAGAPSAFRCGAW